MSSMKTKNKQKLPKWFNGSLYSAGATVSNPFSEEEFYLDRAELSMYDFIMGCSLSFENDMYGPLDGKLLKDFDKARDWFRKKNLKAYMVLLD